MKIRARTEKEKEVKKQRLIEAGCRLFSQYGYRGASISDITKEAGVSTGTFYLYFSSKTEIFRYLNIEGIGILEKMIAESISGKDLTAIEKLKTVADAYSLFFETHRNYYDIMTIRSQGHEDFLNDDISLGILQERGKDLLEILKRIIVCGIEKGEINPVDPDKTVQVLWALMDGIFLLEQRNVSSMTGIGPQETVSEGLGIVLKGLRRQ